MSDFPEPTRPENERPSGSPPRDTDMLPPDSSREMPPETLPPGRSSEIPPPATPPQLSIDFADLSRKLVEAQQALTTAQGEFLNRLEGMEGRIAERVIEALNAKRDYDYEMLRGELERAKSRVAELERRMGEFEEWRQRSEQRAST